jgi:hypothetical protein
LTHRRNQHAVARNCLCSIGNRTLSFAGVLCLDPPEIAPPCFTGVDPPVIAVNLTSNHRKVTKSAVFPPVAGNRLWLHPPSTHGRSGLRSFSLSVSRVRRVFSGSLPLSEILPAPLSLFCLNTTVSHSLVRSLCISWIEESKGRT